MLEIISMFCTKMLRGIAIAISIMLYCNIICCMYPYVSIAKKRRVNI